MPEDRISFAADDTNINRYVGNNPTYFIDPSDLDWLDDAANFAAGWGDKLTFDATDDIRDALGINSGTTTRAVFIRGNER